MNSRLVVLEGHVLDRLRDIPDESIHCVVTSPPYWGLRNYGIAPQAWPDGWAGDLGLEPTPELYVEHMVAVFREVWRVLRKDGTLWLNLGDCYATAGGSGFQGKNGARADRRFTQQSIRHTTKRTDRRAHGRPQANGRGEPQVVPGYRGTRGDSPKHADGALGEFEQPNRKPFGLKPKDLVGMPWRVAFALQADGWWLRMDNIWEKPNPMPESCTDRPTKSHEYMFLMAKSERYFYDNEAIKEPSSPGTHARLSQATLQQQTGGSKQDAYRANTDVGKKSRDRTPVEILKSMARKAGIKADGVKSNQQWWDAHEGMLSSRNKRSVWTITTEPFKDAHFATFPTALVKPCILAGTSARGACPGCGAPYERVVEKGQPDLEHQRACGGDQNGEYHGNNTKPFEDAGAQPASTVKERILKGMVEKKTVDWIPTCTCPPKLPIPCRVLDPFGGAFTTAAVALELGRAATVIELNPKYIAMGQRRCDDVTPGLPL